MHGSLTGGATIGVNDKATKSEKGVRLADLAKAAGVSKGTASNVFNRPSIVREEVRERVLEVAKAIGYAGPDPIGRLLSAGKVNAIGVATVEPLAYFFSDPFARVLMEGIARTCDANGVGISLVSAANHEDLAWNLRSAVVDGFILFCLDGADRLSELARERNLPAVALAFGTAAADISVVSIDNVGASRNVVDYLAGLGHRRFAILSMELVSGSHGKATMDDVAAATYVTSADRIHGYREGLVAHGIDADAVPIHETLSDRDTVAAALAEISAASSPPTAILAESDVIAFHAIDWLKEHGLSVPGDVSVVGFDNVPECERSEPPLTTVAQPIAEIGQRAVEAIIGHDGSPTHVLLPTHLVVRQSTAPPPKDAPSPRIRIA